MKKKQILTLTSNVTGLFIYCMDCRTQKKEKCNKHLEERQYYKLIVHLPTGERVVRQLSSRIEEKAIVEAITLKEGIESGEVQRIENTVKVLTKELNEKNIDLSEEKENNYTSSENDRKNLKTKPTELASCINYYLDFLQNVDVPFHKQKDRSEGYIKEVRKALLILTETCGGNINVNRILDKEVGEVVKTLKNKLGYSAKTFSNKVSVITSFFKFLKEEGIVNTNPFTSVIRPIIRKRPQMVTFEEFKEVIEQVKMSNGKEYFIYEYISKKGKFEGQKRIERKNQWYPWLADAFALALYGGGRRREEIAMLKWSNVFTNSNGELLGGIIRYRNFKVERASNMQFEDEQIPVDIPITPQLLEVLNNLGWKKFKNTDRYVIANNENFSRRGLMDILSRSFTFYYQKTSNPREGISFKSMRKTYITYLRSIVGDLARIVTGHSSNNVIDNHYEDKSLLYKKITEQLIIG